MAEDERDGRRKPKWFSGRKTIDFKKLKVIQTNSRRQLVPICLVVITLIRVKWANRHWNRVRRWISQSMQSMKKMNGQRNKRITVKEKMKKMMKMLIVMMMVEVTKLKRHNPKSPSCESETNKKWESVKCALKVWSRDCCGQQVKRNEENCGRVDGNMRESEEKRERERNVKRFL